MKNARAILASISLLALLVVSFALTACGNGGPNNQEAQLLGVVTSVDISNGTGQILVVWDKDLGARLEFDAAALAVTKSTDVFRRNTDGSYDRIDAADIKERDVVEVQITGPVRESYPVQAEARQVVVIGEWPASKELPVPPGLSPPE